MTKNKNLTEVLVRVDTASLYYSIIWVYFWILSRAASLRPFYGVPIAILQKSQCELILYLYILQSNVKSLGAQWNRLIETVLLRPAAIVQTVLVRVDTASLCSPIICVYLWILSGAALWRQL